MARKRDNHRLELLQGTLDMLVLRTLQWGPRHGYGISQAIWTQSEELLKVETGSLYPHEDVMGDRAFYDRNRIRLTRINYWIGYHGIGVAHLENYSEFEIEPLSRDFEVVEEDAPAQQIKRAVLEGASQAEAIARIIVPRKLYWIVAESGEFEKDWGWNHSRDKGEPVGACALMVEGVRIWLESERHVTLRSARRG